MRESGTSGAPLPTTNCGMARLWKKKVTFCCVFTINTRCYGTALTKRSRDTKCPGLDLNKGRRRQDIGTVRADVGRARVFVG